MYISVIIYVKIFNFKFADWLLWYFWVKHSNCYFIFASAICLHITVLFFCELCTVLIHLRCRHDFQQVFQDGFPQTANFHVLHLFLSTFLLRDPYSQWLICCVSLVLCHCIYIPKQIMSCPVKCSPVCHFLLFAT